MKIEKDHQILENELHTYAAWYALGRQVSKGEKAVKTKKVKTPFGYRYEKLFAFEQTKEARVQFMSCPTSRAMAISKKELKGRVRRDNNTFGKGGTARGDE